MDPRTTNFTTVEQQFGKTVGGVTAEEFDRMKAWFAALPYLSFKMDEADIKRLQELMPKLDMTLVQNAEVKPKNGVCSCGRKITLVDLVAKALSRSAHSGAFLERAFSGTAGKWVIVGLHRGDTITEELKNQYPTSTIFIEDVDLIPCLNCGAAQDVVMFQDHVLHPWGT